MTPSVSPETTVRDLQNARQVLAHLGHTTDEYVDDTTASVCLDGALQLAIWRRLEQEDGVFYSRPLTTDPAAVRALVNRHQAAAAALSAVLPDRCCRDIGPGGTARSRVWHFNDLHCDGGKEADLVLEQAIEKLQADL